MASLRLPNFFKKYYISAFFFFTKKNRYSFTPIILFPYFLENSSNHLLLQFITNKIFIIFNKYLRSILEKHVIDIFSSLRICSKFKGQHIVLPIEKHVIDISKTQSQHSLRSQLQSLKIKSLTFFFFFLFVSNRDH